MIWEYLLGTEIGEAWTRNTVRISVIWYFISIFLMLSLSTLDWLASTVRGRVTRWCWTIAMVAYWVHVIVAFEYYHHWSHNRAFHHVEQASGFGAGIFVSYFFTLLWTVEVLWWWIAVQSYAHRSAWIGILIHAFMLFIVFNGVVVFERGLTRWVGVAVFMVLAITAFLRRRFRPVSNSGKVSCIEKDR